MLPSVKEIEIDYPHIVIYKAEDALHIDLATIHGMDFLVTWNCKHIANAHI
jgi:hypothetical protein